MHSLARVAALAASAVVPSSLLLPSPLALSSPAKATTATATGANRSMALARPAAGTLASPPAGGDGALGGSAPLVQRARRLFDDQILPALTPAERTRVAGAVLAIPADRRPATLDVHTDLDAHRISIPAATLEAFHARARAAVESSGSRLAGGDSRATGTAGDAQAGARATQVERLFTGMVAFVLAHELGHLHAAHEAAERLPAELAQWQEREADAFALVLLRRLGDRAPDAVWGLPAFFSLLVDRHATEAEVGLLDRTHRADPDRLRAMAAHLAASAGREADLRRRAVVRAVAGELVRLAARARHDRLAGTGPASLPALTRRW